jgi:HK97 family phage portal protein
MSNLFSWRKLSTAFLPEKRDALEVQSAGGLSNLSAIWNFLDGGNNGNEAGEPVNDSTALSIATVYSCVRILADSVASLPCRIYDRTPTGRAENIDIPLAHLLQIEANPETSAFSFWETYITHLMLRGNAFAQIQRTAGGEVVAIWNLDPRKTEPVRIGATGTLAYKTSDGMTSGTRIIAAEDMLHTLLLSWDGIVGVSPISALRETLGLALGQQKFMSRLLKNNAVPSLAMYTDAKLRPEDKSRMREDFQALQSGGNLGKVAVLDSGLKIQMLGMSAEDSELLSSRQFSRAEIAAAFRIPPQMVGDLTRQSNNSSEQAALSFVQDTLTPILQRVQIAFRRRLLPPAPNGKPNTSFIEFDLRERLRGDFASTMTGYATGKQWGFYSTNDVRKELGENPIGPEGDVYWYPTNMGNSAQLLNQANTEPITQQPIETEAARNTLGTATAHYIRLYRDAVGRLSARPVEKRDAATVKSIFEPLVTSIADLAADSAKRSTDAPEWRPDPAKAIAEYLQKLTERSATWKPEDIDSIAGQELHKVTRALTMAAHRSIAECAALKGLSHE